MADFMDEEAQVSSGEEEEMSGENPFTFNNLTSVFFFHFVDFLTYKEAYSFADVIITPERFNL